MNLAGQNGQSFVWGSCGTLPLCERMREIVPSFLYSTVVMAVGGGGGSIDPLSVVTGDGIEIRWTCCRGVNERRQIVFTCCII